MYIIYSTLYFSINFVSFYFFRLFGGSSSEKVAIFCAKLSRLLSKIQVRC